MRKYVYDSYDSLSRAAAMIFAEQLHAKPDSVFGLATGSTPLGLYSALAGMYARGEVDFSRASSYNLDEYYPISRKNEQSYYYFMHNNLFDLINMPTENIHLPNGEAEDAARECAGYEALVRKAGVDLQLLGLGNNGHIGFNEPGGILELATHKTALTESTIEANARFFDSPGDVPRYALTMGMGTIMSAKAIIVLASGAAKAPVLRAMFSGKLDPQCPATLLSLHPNVTVLAAKEADAG